MVIYIGNIGTHDACVPTDNGTVRVTSTILHVLISVTNHDKSDLNGGSYGDYFSGGPAMTLLMNSINNRHVERLINSRYYSTVHSSSLDVNQHSPGTNQV